ncbi:spike base protein, RCAP_Rcc01079 family, partial [Bacillus cereus]
YSRPKTMTQVFLYQESTKEIVIDLETWEGEFEASALSQSLDTVPLTGDQVLGIVHVGNFPDKQDVLIDNFPTTQNVAGKVSVENFPAPVKTVSVDNFPTPVKTVSVDNFPTLQQVEVTNQLLPTYYKNAEIITPHDTANFSETLAITVAKTGDVALTFMNGVSVVLNLLQGTVYPFHVKQVKATGTTATGIVALRG